MARNIQDHVKAKDHKETIALDVREIFLSASRISAQERLQAFIIKWSKSEPKLTAWAEENIPEGFAVFELPQRFRRHLRTSNLIERINQELKRRSKVVRIFPNEASCLRLMASLLLEYHEE